MFPLHVKLDDSIEIVVDCYKYDYLPDEYMYTVFKSGIRYLYSDTGYPTIADCVVAATTQLYEDNLPF